MATIIAHPQDTPQPVASPPPEASEPIPDKISAYYSLVFPTFTYYLQTLTVTIGRRCVPAQTASTSDNPQVDVDLGPLKSVSRTHAKIEYDEDEERFVLLVIGRNGAWVDGVWSGSGSKVPLSDRSQIQIASRTFHFVLPPPAPPEDSPSPSSQSSGNRARSPSVDITTYSPPSSIPSDSPPPVHVSITSPKIPPISGTALPSANAIPHKVNSKKRKKPDASSPPLPAPAPESIPPKPQLTYAQLCYRAIKALGGKSSLQEICQWIKDTHGWYRYCNKDWESSVRHNLSSNPGFKKLLRGKDERGKGALWGIDEAHEHAFEELDARKAVGSSGGKDGKITGKKGKGIPLEPALKRSVKGEPKGTPLPPPLTSTPLPPKTTYPVPADHAVKTEPTSVPLPEPPTVTSASPEALPPTPDNPPSPPQASSPTTTSGAGAGSSPFPVIPASVRVPIVVGPLPASHPSSGPPKPIVLHENTLILNPEIFSHLTAQHLQDLEALGAQKALEILQAYIVRYYKEKLKAEGARGRGRGRPRRGRGGGPGRGSTPAGASVAARAEMPLSGSSATPPFQDYPDKLVSVGGAPAAPLVPPTEAPSPIVIVDDDPEDHLEAPAAKRRRLDEPDIDIMST